VRLQAAFEKPRLKVSVVHFEDSVGNTMRTAPLRSSMPVTMIVPRRNFVPYVEVAFLTPRSGSLEGACPTGSRRADCGVSEIHAVDAVTS